MSSKLEKSRFVFVRLAPYNIEPYRFDPCRFEKLKLAFERSE